MTEVAETGPRPRAADDFDVIRSRLAEIQREERNPTAVVADPYCRICGAMDASDVSNKCSGACQGC